MNTLSYSRRMHVWATDSKDAEHTYEGVVRAFEHFGRVVREVLVDNQEWAALDYRPGERSRFNERFLDLGHHYDRVLAEHRLKPRERGWVVVSEHHAALWEKTLRVEHRPLTKYEEVATWNLRHSSSG